MAGALAAAQRWQQAAGQYVVLAMQSFGAEPVVELECRRMAAWCYESLGEPDRAWERTQQAFPMARRNGPSKEVSLVIPGSSEMSLGFFPGRSPCPSFTAQMELLLRQRPAVSLSLHEFTVEWKSILMTVERALEGAGYNEANLSGMSRLRQVIASLAGDGLLYRAASA